MSGREGPSIAELRGVASRVARETQSSYLSILSNLGIREGYYGTRAKVRHVRDGRLEIAARRGFAAEAGFTPPFNPWQMFRRSSRFLRHTYISHSHRRTRHYTLNDVKLSTLDQSVQLLLPLAASVLTSYAQHCGPASKQRAWHLSWTLAGSGESSKEQATGIYRHRSWSLSMDLGSGSGRSQGRRDRARRWRSDWRY